MRTLCVEGPERLSDHFIEISVCQSVAHSHAEGLVRNLSGCTYMRVSQHVRLHWMTCHLGRRLLSSASSPVQTAQHPQHRPAALGYPGGLVAHERNHRQLHPMAGEISSTRCISLEQLVYLGLCCRLHHLAAVSTSSFSAFSQSLPDYFFCSSSCTTFSWVILLSCFRL